MNDVYLINDAELDIAKGRFVVYDDAGLLAAQSDDIDAALALARAQGTRHPAIVDLEVTLEQTYVF